MTDFGIAKPSDLTLEQLDQYRYIDAPAEFSKQTGNVLKAEHIQKLTTWKLYVLSFFDLSSAVSHNGSQTLRTDSHVDDMANSGQVLVKRLQSTMTKTLQKPLKQGSHTTPQTQMMSPVLSNSSQDH